MSILYPNCFTVPIRKHKVYLLPANVRLPKIMAPSSHLSPISQANIRNFVAKSLDPSQCNVFNVVPVERS